MGIKDLLFLGGLGAPNFLFTPWFIAFKLLGYNVHLVPNSFFSLDPVSAFSESLIRLSARFENFDVMGVSYGGNAALYGAYLSEELCTKIDKMVLVCAPILGAPGLMKPLRRLFPGFLLQSINEMAKDSDVVTSIKKLGSQDRITFDLHCIYHERDFIAPFETATLPGVGTNHKLDFDWRGVPRLIMHQAVYIHPKTLIAVITVLSGT
jgi:pimeloyl-ACP methyl ester carboxylesterase